MWVNPKNGKRYEWCGTHEDGRGRVVVVMEQQFGRRDYKTLPESEVVNHWTRVESEALASTENKEGM